MEGVTLNSLSEFQLLWKLTSYVCNMTVILRLAPDVIQLGRAAETVRLVLVVPFGRGVGVLAGAAHVVHKRVGAGVL